MTNSQKWNLILKSSNENSLKLADVVLNGSIQRAPDVQVSYESFCQYLKNNEMSIADQFNVYNKSGEYTKAVSGIEFSEADKNVYENILITKTAMIVVGSIFYID